MPRLLTTLIILLVGIASGCGLNESERAVADTNAAIRAVQDASGVVADRISALPESDLDREAFEPLRQAVDGYMQRMETLSAAIRGLREHFEHLQSHIDERYRPAAENAATACEEALTMLDDVESDEDDYRRAISRIGLCMDRYAAAVSSLANAYQQGR